MDKKQTSRLYTIYFQKLLDKRNLIGYNNNTTRKGEKL